MHKVSEIQITYKTKVPAIERTEVKDPETAFQIFLPYFKDNMEYREELWVLYLNRANQAIGIKLISIGGCSSTVVDPKIIFQGALKVNAQAFILCHNHPSGQKKPSNNDISLTKNLIEIGKLMSLPILDHLIITNDGFYSIERNENLW